jgi:hypothetical protein
MAGVTESSGLTSLARLREHERRQAQQAEAARARAESEQRARLQSERELLRAERERQRIEQTAAQTAEAQRNAELERLEAARAAELERAERAVRSRDELERMLVEERGSRRLAELAVTAQLLRQRTFALLSAALCVASWLGVAALYFGALRPGAEAAVLSAQRSLAEEQKARATDQDASARATRRAENLSRQLAALEAEPHDPRTEVPPARGAPARPGQKPPRATNVSSPPCRDDGDPLNPCLKH